MLKCTLNQCDFFLVKSLSKTCWFLINVILLIDKILRCLLVIITLKTFFSEFFFCKKISRNCNNNSNDLSNIFTNTYWLISHVTQLITKLINSSYKTKIKISRFVRSNWSTSRTKLNGFSRYRILFCMKISHTTFCAVLATTEARVKREYVFCKVSVYPI